MEHIRSDRALWHFEDLCNFCVAVPFCIEEGHRDPLPLRQLLERQPEPFPKERMIGRTIGSDGTRCRVLGDRHGVPDLSLPTKVQRRVGHDAGQPGPEGTCRIVSGNPTPRGDESILDRVVGILIHTQYGPGNPSCWGAVPFDEDPECIAIPRRGETRKFTVLHL